MACVEVLSTADIADSIAAAKPFGPFELLGIGSEDVVKWESEALSWIGMSSYRKRSIDFEIISFKLETAATLA